MIIEIAQITGIISLFLLFLTKAIILSNDKFFKHSGRTAMLWTVIYVFFLFLIALLRELGVITDIEGRAISGFTSVIPVAMVWMHLFLNKRSDISD